MSTATKAHELDDRTDIETSDLPIQELVDRGLKLHRELSALERKKTELDQIKAILRDEAKGKDIDFKGTGGNVARIEQKPDTVCRVVMEDKVPKAAKLAGEHLTDLFTMHPSKGAEKNFELNALKLLPKKAAQALVDLLTVEATAWVRFS
jgi:hypothetical protein